MNKIRNLLLKITEKVTGKPRYHPEEYEVDKKIHWSEDIWISNVFRFHEYLFGREHGIRKEAKYTTAYKNGSLFVGCELYTFEALLSHIEVVIRWQFTYLFEWLTHPKLIFISPMPRPAYITFIIFGFTYSLHVSKQFLPLFGLAIALDSANNSGQATSSPVTYSHTCTGSNLMLTVSINLDTAHSVGQPTTTAVTYNSVSMVKAVGEQNSNAFNYVESSIWLLYAPTTGSNTVSASITHINDAVITGISYTGVNQSNTPDATGVAKGTATGASTATVITIANNAWIIASTTLDASSPSITSPTYTSRTNSALNSGGVTNGYNAVQDTNGPITPAGSTAIGWNYQTNSAVWALAAASIAPAASIPTGIASWASSTISQPFFIPYDENIIIVPSANIGTYFRTIAPLGAATWLGNTIAQPFFAPLDENWIGIPPVNVSTYFKAPPAPKGIASWLSSAIEQPFFTPWDENIIGIPPVNIGTYYKKPQYINFTNDTIAQPVGTTIVLIPKVIDFPFNPPLGEAAWLGSTISQPYFTPYDVNQLVWPASETTYYKAPSIPLGEAAWLNQTISQPFFVPWNENQYGIPPVNVGTYYKPLPPPKGYASWLSNTISQPYFTPYDVNQLVWSASETTYFKRPPAPTGVASWLSSTIEQPYIIRLPLIEPVRYVHRIVNNHNTLAINTVFQATINENVALLTFLMATVNSTVAIRVTLELTHVKGTVALKTTLQTSYQSSTIAIFTTLEVHAVKSTVAILTTMVPSLQNTVALKTTLEVSAEYRTLALKTTLETSKHSSTVALATHLEEIIDTTIALSTKLEAVVPYYANLDQQNLTDGTNVPFGQFNSIRYQGFGFTPTRTGYITAIAISRNKGSQGLNFYFDNAGSNSVPLDPPENALYSFTVPNSQITGGYQVFILPTPLYVIQGQQYCVYLAPWNTSLNIYEDDLENEQFNSGSYSGGQVIINTNGIWSGNSSLTPVYSIWIQQAVTIAINTSLEKVIKSTVAIFTDFNYQGKGTIGLTVTLEEISHNFPLSVFVNIFGGAYFGGIYFGGYGIIYISDGIAIQTVLEKSLQSSTTALKTTLEESPQYKTVALKTTLETIKQSSTVAILTILETNYGHHTSAILTTLESAKQYSTVALLTTLQSTQKYSTVAINTKLETTLISSTVALKTTLESTKEYKTVALLTIFETSFMHSTVAVLTTLEEYKISSTIAISTILEKYPIKSTFAINTKLEATPQYSTVAINTILQEVVLETLAINTQLEAPKQSTVAINTILESSKQSLTLALNTRLEEYQQYKTLALLTILESAKQYSTIALKTTLESTKEFNTVALKTILEIAKQSSTIALLTILESSKQYNTLAIKTSLEVIPQYKTIAVKTFLEGNKIGTFALATSLIGNKRSTVAILSIFGNGGYVTIAIKTTLDPALRFSTIAIFTDFKHLETSHPIAINTTLNRQVLQTVAIHTTLFYFIGYYNDDYTNHLGFEGSSEGDIPKPFGGYIDDGQNWPWN